MQHPPWVTIMVIRARKYQNLGSGLYKNHFVTSFQEVCIEKTFNIPGLKQHNILKLENLQKKP